MTDVGTYLREELLRGGKDRTTRQGMLKRIRSALEGLPERFRPGSQADHE
jgi:hypothetical protein